MVKISVLLADVNNVCDLSLEFESVVILFYKEIVWLVILKGLVLQRS